MSKAGIRATYRQIRRIISTEERLKASLAAARHLEGQKVFQESKEMACYLPAREEFDSLGVIRKIWECKKHCYLPALTEEKTLNFIRYNEGDALEPNRYSILEPVDTARKIEVKKLDLIILPLVAFDLMGHRLGTGGGYYDRTLACLFGENSHKPFILGLGFSSQQAAELPNDPWDVLMEGVLTEKGWLMLAHEKHAK